MNLVGYVRSGPEHDRDRQQDLIGRWCAHRGHNLRGVDRDHDVTRSGRDEALRRIEAGEVDGVVVVDVDRFGDDLDERAAVLERIRLADGAVEVVGEGTCDLDVAVTADPRP
jgi:DNA invertase Pin-like site-specific DNA recombinase